MIIRINRDGQRVDNLYLISMETVGHTQLICNRCGTSDGLRSMANKDEDREFPKIFEQHEKSQGYSHPRSL